jgi:hypothetical protein
MKGVQDETVDGDEVRMAAAASSTARPGFNRL